jgi:hypothetical protein
MADRNIGHFPQPNSAQAQHFAQNFGGAAGLSMGQQPLGAGQHGLPPTPRMPPGQAAELDRNMLAQWEQLQRAEQPTQVRPQPALQQQQQANLSQFMSMMAAQPNLNNLHAPSLQQQAQATTVPVSAIV